MFQIIKGGKAVIPVRLRDQNDDPVDLTGVTAITTCFQNDDGTDLALSLGAGIVIDGNPLLGKLLVSLTVAQVNALFLTDGATLELLITRSGEPDAVQIPSAYSVLPGAC